MPEADNKRIRFFIDICVKGAKDLRDLLSIDENIYLRIHPIGIPQGRDYFVYGVLDEVEKAGVALMRYEEFLSNGSTPVQKDRLERNITTAILDEQMLWVRKLIEILADLIQFQETNTPEYFRHYVLSKVLERLRKIQNENREFYARPNRNLEYQINQVKDLLTQIEQTIDTSRCWYISHRHGMKPSALTAQVADFRTRLKKAILKANGEQKLALGFTYGRAYSEPSESLHPNVSGAIRRVEPRDVEINVGKIGVLAAHILILTRKLLKDRRRKNFIASLARTFRTNRYPREVYRRIVNPPIKKGDFVWAGSLAEVLDVRKSSFGYKSFRLRYLVRPPIESILVDEFPAPAIRKLFDKKTLARQVKIIVSQASKQISPRLVSKALRQSVVDLWERVGLKELYFGRPDLARKKIDEFLRTELPQE